MRTPWLPTATKSGDGVEVDLAITCHGRLARAGLNVRRRRSETLDAATRARRPWRGSDQSRQSPVVRRVLAGPALAEPIDLRAHSVEHLDVQICDGRVALEVDL